MCACVAAPLTTWCAGSLVQQPQSKLRVSVIFKGAQGAQAPGSCMAPRPTPPTLCAPRAPLAGVGKVGAWLAVVQWRSTCAALVAM